VTLIFTFPLLGIFTHDEVLLTGQLKTLCRKHCMSIRWKKDFVGISTKLIDISILPAALFFCIVLQNMLSFSNSIPQLCIPLFQSSFCYAPCTCVYFLSQHWIPLYAVLHLPLLVFSLNTDTFSSRSHISTTHVFCPNKNWNNVACCTSCPHVVYCWFECCSYSVATTVSEVLTTLALSSSVLVSLVILIILECILFWHFRLWKV